MTRTPMVLTLAALAVTAAVAVAGPPWISIEYPVNPMDPDTRGAVMLIHTYHHQDVVWMPTTCVAEGLVNGQRRSVPLELARTSRPAVYALKTRPPLEGTWMLVISVMEGQTAGATALVDLGANGEVLKARVPTQTGHPWPRAVTAAEVDSTLRARARTVQVAGT